MPTTTLVRVGGLGKAPHTRGCAPHPGRKPDPPFPVAPSSPAPLEAPMLSPGPLTPRALVPRRRPPALCGERKLARQTRASPLCRDQPGWAPGSASLQAPPLPSHHRWAQWRGCRRQSLTSDRASSL